MGLGRKIYFNNVTGEVILITSQIDKYYKETSFEEDYNFYMQFRNYDKDVIDCIKLEYGEHDNEFSSKVCSKVDLSTKELIFEDNPQSEDGINRFDMLENKISILEEENQLLKKELTQIQTSIASLTSLIAKTLEEK